MNGRDIEAEAATAWVLREKGATVSEIADHLGVSRGTAHNRIRLAADAQVVTGDLEDRRPARIREAASLDEMDAYLADYMQRADDPNPTARTRLLVSAARRALLGLDHPRRLAIRVDDERTLQAPDPVIAAAVEQARADNEQRRAALERPGPSPSGDQDRPATGP